MKFFKVFILFFATALMSCSDFLEPVKATPTPTEYEYNYFLLEKTYLFEDEIPSLPKKGDSTEFLYRKLKDPYTRYSPPAKSEATQTQINTSIVAGDIGIEIAQDLSLKYPLFVYRVYYNGPAKEAEVPTLGNIISINNIELTGENAYDIYNDVLQKNKGIVLKIYFEGETKIYTMTKESFYAPTVFADNFYGYKFISIAEFKLTTSADADGSYGELKALLDSTRRESEVRIIDIRNNPGGHVSQCVNMADLFVRDGILSSRKWRSFDGYGNSIVRNAVSYANAGDAGEKGKFLILANQNSASCAEIFAAALTEGAQIPMAGTLTYGKGIGQSNYQTIAGGYAIITNLEFFTPKGNSYHKRGIVPDFSCENLSTKECIDNAIEKFYGKNALKKSKPSQFENLEILPKNRGMGGAIVEGELF